MNLTMDALNLLRAFAAVQLEGASESVTLDQAGRVLRTNSYELASECEELLEADALSVAWLPRPDLDRYDQVREPDVRFSPTADGLFTAMGGVRS